MTYGQFCTDDILGVCDQKVSYKHVCGVGGLRNCGCLKHRTQVKDYRKYTEQNNKGAYYIINLKYKLSTNVT